MDGLGTRRSFFEQIYRVLAGGTIAHVLPSQATGRIPEPPNDGEDYYEKLGVTKIVNAAGTYTNLTASIMPDSVQAAVARAAETPVRLVELQKAAGEYLAQKLHCEAAMVTA